MKIRLIDFLNSKNGRKSLLIALLAAVLLELISAAQYYFSRYLMEQELEDRIVVELNFKTHALNETLMSAQQTVQEHLWDIGCHLNQPDSIFQIVKRLVNVNDKVVGASMPFIPDYFPAKGRLFEPYAYKKNDSVYVEQLGGKRDHDYTQHPAFQKVLEYKHARWSNPYKYMTDNDSVEQSLITYTYPVADHQGDIVAVCGLDVSLSWLGDAMNATQFNASSFYLFLTASGELMAGPSEQRTSAEQVNHVVRLMNDSSVQRKMARNHQVKVIKFYDHVKKDKGFIYYRTMEEDPFCQAVLVCYYKETYGRLDRMRWFISLLMLAGFILLGLIISRNIRSAWRLQLAHIEQERIGGELHVANVIQNTMLPKHYPPFPERHDIDIYGLLEPALEVAGDLFDFFIRDEKLFFCIGDVSGKSVPSAMVMSVTHTAFRMASAHSSHPAQIMQIINETVCAGNESNMFVTMFIGILDMPTGQLRYCNAGHDKPVLISNTSSEVTNELLPANANLPVGVFSDYKYEMQETRLTPDTTVFLYTDGLTEAMNRKHQLFGMERLMQSSLMNADARGLVEHMSQQVRQFREGAEQSDDLTMLAIRYLHHETHAVYERDIVLKNDVSAVSQLSDFLKEVMAQLHVDTSTARNIRLAVEEAVVNVMDYAYPAGQDGDIQVTAKSDGSRVKFVISDSGIPFDPTSAQQADTTLSVEERPIGGLGLLLVRKLMDAINYERTNGHNVLTLMKNIQA